MDTVLRFGKYKDSYLSDVYDEDPGYVEWLYNNVDSESLRADCYELMNPKVFRRLEEVVIDALTHRGYSDTESKMIVRKLKSNYNRNGNK